MRERKSASGSRAERGLREPRGRQEHVRVETRVLLFWTKLFSTRPTFPGRGPVNRTDRQIYKEKTEQTRLTYRCPCVPGERPLPPKMMWPPHSWVSGRIWTVTNCHSPASRPALDFCTSRPWVRWDGEATLKCVLLTEFLIRREQGALCRDGNVLSRVVGYTGTVICLSQSDCRLEMCACHHL